MVSHSRGGARVMRLHLCGMWISPTGQLLFNGCGVSVWDDAKIQELDLSIIRWEINWVANERWIGADANEREKFSKKAITTAQFQDIILAS